MTMQNANPKNDIQDEHSTKLGEVNKKTIDNYMKNAIDANRFAPLKTLMCVLRGFRRHIKEQHVIDYIEAKYLLILYRYLLIDCERLESQLFEALKEAAKTSDAAAAKEIRSKILSRDWNGQI